LPPSRRRGSEQGAHGDVRVRATFRLSHPGSVDGRGTCHDLCVGSTGCSRERVVGDLRSTCGGGAHSGPVPARHGRASGRHAGRAV